MSCCRRGVYEHRSDDNKSKSRLYFPPQLSRHNIPTMPPFKLVLTADEVLDKGLTFFFSELQINRVYRRKNMSRFRAHYQSHPRVYAVLLTKLQETDNENARLTFDPTDARVTVEKLTYYYFMAVHFLACYPRELEAEGEWGVCDKTWREWVWRIVEKIHLLKGEVVYWPLKWNNPDNLQDPNSEAIFIITVDGTHCQIEEPTHADFSENTKYYSHKFNTSAYDYEIAISTFDDRVVWAAGPYPAGVNDITIFRKKLLAKIEESRVRSGVSHRAIGDKGYRGERGVLSVPSSQDTEEVRAFKARALSRHETFNKRMKDFDCLDERFRHKGHPRDPTVRGSEVKHQWCFNAVLVICQLQMENGSPVFRV